MGIYGIFFFGYDMSRVIINIRIIRYSWNIHGIFSQQYMDIQF